MVTLRRIAPALCLLLLSPVIAEFLLGDFSVGQLGLVLVFIPQYGGGALLVREVARRAHRGWPTILLLALAYALIEEGFTTQTLFNPNYAGARLLDYGFIPALGTSLDWSVFVLTLHVVWSIGSAIAIAEGLAGSRWATPWLGRIGLAVTTVLFLAGCLFTTAITLKMFPYVSSVRQFATVAILTGAAVAAAFLFFPADRPRRLAGSPPSVWVVGATTLALASAFHLVSGHASACKVHPALALAGILALELIAIVVLLRWSDREGWGPRHALAAATGAILTYGWLSISRFAAGTTALGVRTTAFDVAWQAALVAAVLVLVLVGTRRLASAGVGRRAAFAVRD
jgi:hypothetical protein